MSYLFFFNDTATTEIYTLSLHDALPILSEPSQLGNDGRLFVDEELFTWNDWNLVTSLPGENEENETERNEFEIKSDFVRSEEHTSELQSRLHLVCRLLLEKKKK